MKNKAGKITMSEKLNYLHEKYEDKMEGFYHNLLWQLLMNGAREENPKRSALTLLLDNGLGLADEGKSGYTPTQTSIKKSVPRDEANKIVSTPAYMLGPNIAKVAEGIEKLVKKVLELA